MDKDRIKNLLAYGVAFALIIVVAVFIFREKKGTDDKIETQSGSETAQQNVDDEPKGSEVETYIDEDGIMRDTDGYEYYNGKKIAVNLDELTSMIEEDIRNVMCAQIFSRSEAHCEEIFDAVYQCRNAYGKQENIGINVGYSVGELSSIWENTAITFEFSATDDKGNEHEYLLTVEYQLQSNFENNTVEYKVTSVENFYAPNLQ